ncbi:MAG: GAF domain-containing sensor histidine kinase [Bradymonadales bacterium]|nr:GAF domain-containing sensor histidine kinase [Bradymonadales bacterium]
MSRTPLSTTPFSSDPLEVIDRQILVTSLWFLKVRWIAVATMVLAGLVAGHLGYPLSLPGVSAVAGYLALANLGFYRHARRFREVPVQRSALDLFVNLQIMADWLAVLAIVYLTGGVISPCSLFFVFHILMASILLPARQTFIQASLALVLVALLFLLEGLAFLPYQPLILDLPFEVHREPRFVVAVLFVLALTIYASILLGNWVGQLLRRRMRQLTTTKSRLEDATQRMQAIFEVMRMLAGNRELEEMLATIALQATRLWGIQAACILLVDPRTQSLQFAATHGLDDSNRPDRFDGDWASQWETYLTTRDTLFKNDLSRHLQDKERTIYGWLAGQQLQSLMVVPLRVGQTTIGGFCLSSQIPSRFDREDAKYFKVFADLVSIQIEMVRANQRLLSHSQTRTWFFNKVAHDLRSPLAAVQSLMSLVTEGYVDQLDQAKTLVERASRRIEGLSSMVNELLVMATNQFDNLEPALTQIDVRTVLDNMVQLYEVEAHKKGVAVEVHTDPQCPPVNATPDGIERILSNLLSNAIKYTPRGGEVKVSLKNVEDRYLLFSITDTGIGIPAEAAEHIFEEFYRAPNARKLDEVGTGLGLAITRRFVEDFGGRLVFESTEGQGTTFSFFLPAAGTQPAKVKAIARELGWGKR